VPQASDELRARWGEQVGGNPIAFLTDRGFLLTREFTWVLPAGRTEVDEDEASAITYLVDEWDFGGIEP
jgi:hypothetical protein